MNRRSFFKWIGVGTVTAAVAPKLLAEHTPEFYPESNYPITLDMLQKSYADTLPHMRAGYYMMIRLASTSLPVSAGDIVYFKNDKRGGTLAYKRKKLTFRNGERYGYGIGSLTPGNYGFIQIPAMQSESYDVMMEQTVLTIDGALRKGLNA